MQAATLSCRLFAIAGWTLVASGFVVVATVPGQLQASATKCQTLELSRRLQALWRKIAGWTGLRALQGALHGSVQDCRQPFSSVESYGEAVPCRRQTWPSLAPALQLLAVVVAGRSCRGRPWWVIKRGRTATLGQDNNKERMRHRTVKLGADVE
jgi:hypothetical protein